MNDQQIKDMRRQIEEIAPMLDKLLDTIRQITAPEAPKTLHIVRVERGESSGSKSPKWTCDLLEGGKLWVFQHSDPARNNFPLFEDAGYGILTGMRVGEHFDCYETPIEITAEKEGNFWRVLTVAPKTDDFHFDPESAALDDVLPAKSRREVCIETARHWLKHKALVVDTETTGLGNRDQIVSIAVIEVATGAVLVDSLVRPTGTIPAAATAVHGITDEMVEDAPYIDELQLENILAGRTIIAYSADFDERMLRQSFEANGLNEYPVADWVCAKLLYAEFAGEWNEYRNSWKWHKLADACKKMQIEFTGTQHSAVGDAQATLALVKAIANSDIPF